MRLEAWSASNIGLVRRSNQDAVGCFPELQLAIVADGMGGHAHGEVASRMAIDVIHDTLRSARHGTAQPWWRRLLDWGRPAQVPLDGEQLRTAVELANRRIFEAGQDQRTEGASMGTTVVLLHCALDARQAYWAHVGDSRLYRVRSGELTLLTADHTKFGEAYWNQTTVPTNLEHTNVLMRALGATETVAVSAGADALSAGDLFLLCSDGVSGLVTPETIRETLRGANDLATAGELLIRRALDAGGRDNASVVLVRVIDG